MPDEEMDMAVDFGQEGFGEDIDIDLDFPAGPTDDDMELEDFEIHNFNSDAHDELMAEGDDASYGMVDVTESDYNVLGAGANDIDIELEHTVESIWQQDSSHSVGLHPDTEIDYLDETATEKIDTEKINAGTTGWLSAATTSQNTDVTGHADGVPAETYASAPQEPLEELAAEPPTSHEDPSPSAQTLQTDREAINHPTAPSLEGNEEPSDIDDLRDETVGVEPEVSDHSSPAKQDEHSAGQPGVGPDIAPRSPDVGLQESEEHQETLHLDEPVPAASNPADNSLVSQDLEQPEYPGFSEATNAQNHDDPSQPEETYESDGVSEHLLGDALYGDNTNDQTGDDNEAPQAGSPSSNHPDSEPTEASRTRDIEDEQNDETMAADAKTPATGISDRDNPIELADHYSVYVSYGETDYQLFARSDNDDPNHYFLTDRSVLDVPLAQFLISLREVISEEISPLDDLVMEIDGLGLEFSESTTPDFIGKFTFGDLVVLYDKLVKNERAEPCPPIYTFLTVKPNCTRRMMALGESANAGRGLSEVGLYREASSMGDEQVDGVGSPDTNFSTADYNDGESGSIYPQEDFEESDIVNSDEHGNSTAVTAEVQLEHDSDQNGQNDELDDESEGNPGNGSADAAHHEHDASTSEQGICPVLFHRPPPCTQDSTCLCDECYEVMLQHLVTPMRAEVWPAPSKVITTYNNSTHMSCMTNRTITKDEATSESLALNVQEAPESSQQSHQETSEADQSKPAASKTTPTNPPADALNSENTSVTATLDGEDHDENRDEIDYNSDDDESIINGSNMQKQSPVHDSNAPVDDEITWESEDDEAENETKGGSPRDTVQVSPVSGKRSRGDMDASDDAGDKNDYKRLRA
ncbi:hypothetical protein F5Y07DRAFT_386734 [Xylaria sp. FL0933]|nr:hypothetical protein F5Y07DRAFT_386734 [Xylaria sp. FL0933]